MNQESERGLWVDNPSLSAKRDGPWVHVKFEVDMAGDVNEIDSGELIWDLIEVLICSTTHSRLVNE